MQVGNRPKVVLALQDSETSNPGGLVCDCCGGTPINSHDLSKFEAVGTWQKIDDGVMIVELTTTIEARQDILIGLLKSMRERRMRENGNPLIDAKYPGRQAAGVKAGRTRSGRSNSGQVERAPRVNFQSLRNKLKENVQ